MDIEALKNWFQENKRDFLWRQEKTPYRVWIAEVMLQQTRADVVEGYYARWMAHFPTIETLAEAPFEQVIKLWEGLGYYSRVRHIHAAAKYLALHEGGKLPCDREKLARIPGLGPYTIGAILSFAFQQKSPAVDGNVMRVLSRFFAIDEDISKSSTKKQFTEYTENLLPDHEPWVVMEALIELGATVCQKKPRCNACPLSSECLGRGRAAELPFKAKKIAYLSLAREVGVVQYGEELLLHKETGKKLMADLFEFPYSEGDIQSYLEKELGLRVYFKDQLTPVKQTFTRFRVQLQPSYWMAQEKAVIPGYTWVGLQEIERLPFSSGHRKIWQEIRERIR